MESTGSKEICGFFKDCAPKYSLFDVNASAAEWDPLDQAATNAYLKARQNAVMRCTESATANQDHGTWCLTARPWSSTQNCTPTSGPCVTPAGDEYAIPESHHQADGALLRVLLTLLRPSSDNREYRSLMDFGSAVGQYGHSLRSVDSKAAQQFRGYEGAGNVEQWTHVATSTGLTSHYLFRSRRQTGSCRLKSGSIFRTALKPCSCGTCTLTTAGESSCAGQSSVVTERTISTTTMRPTLPIGSHNWGTGFVMT